MADGRTQHGQCQSPSSVNDAARGKIMTNATESSTLYLTYATIEADGYPTSLSYSAVISFLNAWINGSRVRPFFMMREKSA